MSPDKATPRPGVDPSPKRGEEYSRKFFETWIEFDKLNPRDAERVRYWSALDLSTIPLEYYLLVVTILFSGEKFMRAILGRARLVHNLSDTELEEVWTYMFLKITRLATNGTRQYSAFSMDFFRDRPQVNQLTTAVKALRSVRAESFNDQNSLEAIDTSIDIHREVEESDSVCRALLKARSRIRLKWQNAEAWRMYWLTWILVDIPAFSVSEIRTIMGTSSLSAIESALTVPRDQWKNDPFVLECNCLHLKRPVFAGTDSAQRAGANQWAADVLKEKGSTTEDRLCKVRKLLPGFSPLSSRASSRAEEPVRGLE